MTKPGAKIHFSEPRKTIRVTVGEHVIEGPVGSTTGEFLGILGDDYFKAPLIACTCDGQLRELTYPLVRDATLTPVLLSSSDGGRIYRRSLVMLMTTAAAELWPGCQISVRHAVPDGGFYCTHIGENPFTAQ